jgi:hypothetical protein
MTLRLCSALARVTSEQVMAVIRPRERTEGFQRPRGRRWPWVWAQGEVT